MKIFTSGEEVTAYQVKEFLQREDFNILGGSILDLASDPEWNLKNTTEKAQWVLKRIFVGAGFSVGIPAVVIILKELGVASIIITLWGKMTWLTF